MAFLNYSFIEEPGAVETDGEHSEPVVVCPHCFAPKPDIQRRLTNTMYNDDASNYMESCEACYNEYCDEIQSLYDDIYSDQYASVQHAILEMNHPRSYYHSGYD